MKFKTYLLSSTSSNVATRSRLVTVIAYSGSSNSGGRQSTSLIRARRPASLTICTVQRQMSWYWNYYIYLLVILANCILPLSYYSTKMPSISFTVNLFLYRKTLGFSPMVIDQDIGRVVDCLNILFLYIVYRSLYYCSEIWSVLSYFLSLRYLRIWSDA